MATSTPDREDNEETDDTVEDRLSSFCSFFWIVCRNEVSNNTHNNPKNRKRNRKTNNKVTDVCRLLSYIIDITDLLSKSKSRSETENKRNNFFHISFNN
jgi:hypothetical protein